MVHDGFEVNIVLTPPCRSAGSHIRSLTYRYSHNSVSYSEVLMKNSFINMCSVFSTLAIKVTFSRLCPACIHV